MNKRDWDLRVVFSLRGGPLHGVEVLVVEQNGGNARVQMGGPTEFLLAETALGKPDQDNLFTFPVERLLTSEEFKRALTATHWVREQGTPQRPAYVRVYNEANSTSSFAVVGSYGDVHFGLLRLGEGKDQVKLVYPHEVKPAI